MRIIRIVVAATIVLASCGGDDDIVVEPASSTTTTVDEGKGEEDLFQEVETEDQAAETVDRSDASEATSSDPTSADPVSSDPMAGEADSGSEDADQPTGTDPGTSGDTTVDPSDEDVCVRVQRLADAFESVDDADASVDPSAGEAGLRTALEEAVAALTSTAQVAPIDVAGDIAIVVEGLELQIAVEFGDGQLTPEQQQLLDGEELDDAGDRVADFAVGVCGIELS